MLLDGSTEVERRLNQMLHWDVTNGISRRCWSGNLNANETIKKAMKMDSRLKVTLPNQTDDDDLDEINFYI